MKKLLITLVFVFSSFTNADAPIGYYDSALGKNGSALKTALHNIIDGHTVIPYTGPRTNDWLDHTDWDVWEALIFTDSACDDTNPNCGLVQLLYLDEARHYDLAYRGGRDSHHKWEREHVWPKSRGFKEEKQDGYTDLHHLRPADKNINNKHSNYGFDEGGTIVKDKLRDGTEVATTMRLDKTNQSFEPSDRAKGQVARMVFYMATRYEMGDDQGAELMPDLTLKDDNQKVKEPWIGDLCTLLKWNNTFAVSDFERRRNERVFKIQNNRNPFIDNPGFANLIWGEQC
ncbi:MAG: endonuclease I [Alteromonadaceae bacterium]|nr:endonuclease I [Alteromonadaceae bacterium]